MKVAAIIPAYNEANTIADVICNTAKYVDKVFVVDDGSKDNTSEIAQQFGAEVIRHYENLGIGAALQSGYDAAVSNGFDYIVQVDSDGQHDPKYIPAMLEAVQECDIVIASRFLNDSHKNYPFVRRLGISFFSLVVSLLIQARITDTTSGYRVYRAECLKRLGRLPDRHWAVAQTLEAGKRGLRIKEVSVEMPVRGAGESQFSLKTYAFYPYKMILVVLKSILCK